MSHKLADIIRKSSNWYWHSNYRSLSKECRKSEIIQLGIKFAIQLEQNFAAPQKSGLICKI